MQTIELGPLTLFRPGGEGTMGHIIALPCFKNKIDLSTGNPILDKFFLMDWVKKLFIFVFINLVFEHKTYVVKK